MTTQQRLRALPDKAERLAKANEFIRVIATTGRKFFAHEGAISLLFLDSQGRIWILDSYSKRHIYTHYHGAWKGFTNGGTMQQLIIRLREYIQGEIKTGDDLFRKLHLHQRNLQIWPDHPWGYPEPDMAIVIREAHRIFCSAGETHETQAETALELAPN